MEKINNYTVGHYSDKMINEYTPLEAILAEIVSLRKDAEKINLDNDVIVLKGIENLITKRMFDNEIEEKLFVTYGMTLLTAGLEPNQLTDERLNDVFEHAQLTFKLVFNAKELFNKKQKNERKRNY